MRMQREMKMNDNIFTLGKAGKAEPARVTEEDVHRVQFNNWQRDVLQELKCMNSNLDLLKKYTKYVAILIVAGMVFAFIHPWFNSP